MQPSKDNLNAAQEQSFSLNPMERLQSRVNTWRLALRDRMAFSRAGYQEKGFAEQSWKRWLEQWPAQTQFTVQKLETRYQLAPWRSRLQLLNYVKNLNTLWVLERLLADQNLTGPKPAWITEAGCHDFVRAPAITQFLSLGLQAKEHQLTGIELDAFPILQNLHSRADKAQYYLSWLPQAQYLAGDFFTLFQPSQLLVAFYPFVSPHPSLAWGLPSDFGDATLWVKAMEKNLTRNGLALLVHQGTWEEDEFSQALKEAQRKGSSLQLVKQMAVNCPFFPTRFPALASLYRKT